MLNGHWALVTRDVIVWCAADKGRALQIQTKWNYPNPQQMLRVLRRRRGKQTGPCPGNNKIHQSTHTHTHKRTEKQPHACIQARARTHTHIDRLLSSSSSHLPRPRWIHYPLPRRRAEFAWWPAFGLVHIPHRQQHPRWPYCFRRWGWRLWIYIYFTCGLNTKN